MNWSPEQDEALLAVDRWLKAGDTPVFRLFGYAGAGKTTLARHFAENAGGDVAENFKDLYLITTCLSLLLK